MPQPLARASSVAIAVNQVPPDRLTRWHIVDRRRGSARAVGEGFLEDMATAPEHATGRVRSYHARNGRMTPGRHAAIDRLAPKFAVEAAGDPLDLASMFGAGTPVVLEIGFGMGDATAAMAAAEPDVAVLATEVHQAGVSKLLSLVDAQGLTNLRVVYGDAVPFVEERIPEGSLAGVRIFFPDPWRKVRHHKRRLLQPAFVALLASRLTPGGFVHCATDWADYATSMFATLTAEPLLVNAHDGYAPRPTSRPVTPYERRGLERGHAIVDLEFTRRT